MKKFLCFLLFALCLTTAANAQTQTLTIGEPVEWYSSTIPIYGLWLDSEGTLSQFIIPADSLTDMDGGTISKMFFYTYASYFLETDDSYSPAYNEWLHETNTVFSVALSEVNEIEFVSGDEPSGYNHSSLTEVYHGTFPESLSQLEIDFDNPYPYHGGNLLVSINVEVPGTYGTCYWLGVSDEVTNVSYYQYNYYDNLTFSPATFMPKTTFEYVPSTCETPTNVTVSDITANSATVEWTGNQEQYIVKYKEDAASDWTTTTTSNNSLTLTSLEPETTYEVQVQGICEDDESEWSEVVTLTTTATPDEPEEPEEPGECGPAVDCEGNSYPTVKIGDICWMAKNLAAETCVTAGNVYAYVNDQFPDEAANVETYGLLYDEDAAMQGNGAKAAATGICPEGYTLPTTEQFEYLKNNYTANELRNSTGWVASAGTNGTGFSWDGAGFRNGTSETFEHMLLEGYLWAVDMTSGTPQPAMYKMMYYCNEIVRVYDFDGISASIRCVKVLEPIGFKCGTDKMIDADYNEYETVEIGTQCWTKTNMRTTKDKDGNDLTDPVADGIFPNSSYDDPYYYRPTAEAWAQHNSEIEFTDYSDSMFGLYYNWAAANKICPAGWHLPSDEEWTAMERTLTEMDVSGTGQRGDHAGKLSGSNYWYSSDNANAPGNTTYSDWGTSGFSAVPAGGWYPGFYYASYDATFWSSTEPEGLSNKAWYRNLNYDFAGVYKLNDDKITGHSVRCIKDASGGGDEPTSFNCGIDKMIDADYNEYETVKIGTQCWTKTNMRTTKDKNGYDLTNPIDAGVSPTSNYTAYYYRPTQEAWEEHNELVVSFSSSYSEEEFGLYYNWAAANKICPKGWHLPSDAEWTALTDYVGGSQSEFVCGGDNTYIAKALSSTSNWVVSTDDSYPCEVGYNQTGNNATDFSAVPAGTWSSVSGFDRAGYFASFWSSKREGTTDKALYYRLSFNQEDVHQSSDNMNVGLSVRCVKDVSGGGDEPTSFNCGTDFTIGENSYETVQIGTQCWTKTNMRETKDKDGNDITNPIDAGVSTNYSNTVPYYYNYSTSNIPLKDRGYLYNWAAANVVCPAGWRLPSEDDWTALTEYVGNQSEFVCGGDNSYIARALATGDDYWYREAGAWLCEPEYYLADNNATGFTAVPAGYWRYDSNFSNERYYAQFWSSEHEDFEDLAWIRRLEYNKEYVDRIFGEKHIGFSVRCVRDLE